jgi:hypothetical protein
MSRTPAVNRLKQTIILNPGLTASQLARRLGITHSTLQSLLVQAEAQGLLLTETLHRPVRIYLFRDLTDPSAIPTPQNAPTCAHRTDIG